MLPVIAIVGRTNVGKSTLFNRLTKSKAALTLAEPGVTRDRLYGETWIDGDAYIVIDSGGLSAIDSSMDEQITAQSKQAIAEADAILFLVDARAGVTSQDQIIAQMLRRQGKKIALVVNKVDTLDERLVTAEFHQLGLGEPHPIAARQGQGVARLMQAIKIWQLPKTAIQVQAKSNEPQGIKVAILGRPNVGKSTLINRFLGEARVIVSDQPGTTHDSVAIPLARHNKNYVLIDTAGIRRRGRITQTLEKFSIVQSLKSADRADVVLFLMDAQEGVTDQDLNLIRFVVERGRALVIAMNKWDGLSMHHRQRVRAMIDRRLGFVDYARVQPISALHGTGVGGLLPLIQSAYESASRQFATPHLTHLLQEAITAHPPPLHRRRRIKLRYAHPGGKNPLIIVIYGNQVDALPAAYKRYLSNFYRKSLHLVGSHVRLIFKGSDNPFAGRKRVYSEHAIKKHKRLLKHVKKQDK